MKSYKEGFEKLVLNQGLLLQLSDKTVEKTDYPLAPQGLRVYWDTLYKFNGWSLQKNYYFNHCRIVDEYKVKRAWGTEEEMISTLEALALQA